MIPMVRYAKIAATHEDIERMPMGYRTLVGDMESALSGGQLQRLLIARALYRRPTLLLMDQATSHLDHMTELIVKENLKDMKITQIIIAHGQETIDLGDRVFDLTNGGEKI